MTLVDLALQLKRCDWGRLARPLSPLQQLKMLSMKVSHFSAAPELQQTLRTSGTVDASNDTWNRLFLPLQSTKTAEARREYCLRGTRSLGHTSTREGCICR